MKLELLSGKFHIAPSRTYVCVSKHRNNYPWWFFCFFFSIYASRWLHSWRRIILDLLVVHILDAKLFFKKFLIIIPMFVSNFFRQSGIVQFFRFRLARQTACAICNTSLPILEKKQFSFLYVNFFSLEMNQKNPGDVSKWQCEMSDNNNKTFTRRLFTFNCELIRMWATQPADPDSRVSFVIEKFQRKSPNVAKCRHFNNLCMPGRV